MSIDGQISLQALHAFTQETGIQPGRGEFGNSRRAAFQLKRQGRGPGLFRLEFAPQFHRKAGLSTLPTWDASPTLAARVLGRLTPATDRAVVASMPSDRERAARRRVIIAGLLTGGGVAAGFTWAVLNPAAAQGLAGPAVTEVSQALWLSLQGLVANTIEQPWFGTVRDALASPTRALPYLVGAGVAYALTLVGFRRLLTSPATDAGW